MSGVFNMLRANDLIWSFVVNNYPWARTPWPSTRCTELRFDPHAAQDAQLLPAQHVPEQQAQRMPAASRCSASRSISPRSRRRCSSRPPRKTTSRRGPRPTGTQLLGGPVSSCSAAPAHRRRHQSGDLQKYGFQTNDKLPPNAGDWLAGAEQHDGSWWNHWKTCRPDGRREGAGASRAAASRLRRRGCPPWPQAHREGAHLIRTHR